MVLFFGGPCCWGRLGPLHVRGIEEPSCVRGLRGPLCLRGIEEPSCVRGGLDPHAWDLGPCVLHSKEKNLEVICQ